MSQTAEKAGQPKQMTIAERKALVCAALQKIFSNKLMEHRLLKMAGGDSSKVAKNLTAFLSLIMEDDGGSKDPKKKKYLCQCTTASLTTVFLESMNMQLPFDSRKLVSIIIYDWEATLDISYKGFVNALNRHFTNAFVECKLVFEDDVFEAEVNGREAVYKYKPADPFAVVTPDFKNIKGGYCYFAYTDTDGKPTSRLVFLSRAQILKNKSCAVQQYVWEAHPKAMAEKSCIREGARLPFAAIDLDVDIEEVDNRHYQLEKPEGSDKLKLLMAAQEEVVHGKQSEEDEKTTKEKIEEIHSENPNGADAIATQADNRHLHAAGGASAPGGTGVGRDNVLGTPGRSAETFLADSPRIQEKGKEITETNVFDSGGYTPYDNAPQPISEADFEELPPGNPDARAPDLPVEQQTDPEPLPGGWDGRTVYTGDGKTRSMDFAGPQAALVYVKRIMASRKHKASRKDIIEHNSPLIGALIKEGHGSVVAELHQLADKGE